MLTHCKLDVEVDVAAMSLCCRLLLLLSSVNDGFDVVRSIIIQKTASVDSICDNDPA